MEADVVVLGSGFGGSLCALIAHRIGLRPVVIERGRHPRFAVGESSTPSADVVLRDLADRYDLPRLRPLSTWGTWQRTYPEILGGMKRGFGYFRHEAGRPFTPDPEHSGELLVAASSDDERSDTQWYRADVDAFFAGEVQREGIPLIEGARVETFRDGKGWRLEGAGLDVAADFVIDATGGSGALGEVLHVADASARLRTRTRALFSHFRGVPRWRDVAAELGAGVDAYPFDPDWSALHHVFEGGWMWMLRFENDLLSAGFVLDEAVHPLEASEAPEAEFHRHLDRYPTLRGLFADARTAPIPGKLIRTSRLQRRLGHAAGPGWAMLPHTAGFVDPLHSTGIAHTLCGVERLMGLLEEHWGGAGLTGALETYQRSVLRELEFVDRLVYPCYAAIGSPAAPSGVPPRASSDSSRAESFRRWTASTMLYFAAATSYEHGRAAGSADGLYLLADDEQLWAIAEEAARRLEAGLDTDSYEAWLEETLRPYNRVGLFRPRIPNMYEYTAAPK